MMEIFLLLLIVTLLLLILLLAIPVDIRFSASMASLDGPFNRAATLSWAFGAVTLPLGRRRARGSRRREVRTKPKAPEKRSGGFKLRGLLMMPEAWARLKVLLVRLLRSIHWHVFRLQARFGLDDPADTGRLWGVVGPILAVGTPARREVRIEPAFDGPEVYFEGEGRIRLVPLRVFGVLLSFALAPATLRLLWLASRRR